MHVLCKVKITGKYFLRLFAFRAYRIFSCAAHYYTQHAHYIFTQKLFKFLLSRTTLYIPHMRVWFRIRIITAAVYSCLLLLFAYISLISHECNTYSSVPANNLYIFFLQLYTTSLHPTRTQILILNAR